MVHKSWDGSMGNAIEKIVSTDDFAIFLHVLVVMIATLVLKIGAQICSETILILSLI